jgi:hypothetical protein
MITKKTEVVSLSHGVTSGTAVLCSLVVGLALSVVGPANAQIVLTENFPYSDGNLTNSNPAWVTHSGTANPILVAGGAAVLKNNAAGYDIHRLFDGAATFNSGTVSASFDMVVNATSAPIGGGDYEYFAYFWQTTAATSFRSRTDIVNPGTAGGNYSMGIATLSGTAEFTLGNQVGFAYGQTVPVTITFDITGGTGSLTAGGQTIYTAVVSTGQNIDGFGFRQETSSGAETITIDNLIVTHTPVPEPTTLALGGLGMMAFFMARRRR